MNTPKIVHAMNYIDDDLISGAVTYTRTKQKYGWLKWGTMAACLCLVILVAIPIIRQHEQGATDIEPRTELTLEEAINNTTFGGLFPTIILEGYAVEEGTVAIYNETVLTADFYNTELNTAYTVRIANKEWFDTQVGNVELNTVLYPNYDSRNSRIYIDGGDQIVAYYFTNADISEIDGFYEMVTSAAYFTKLADTGECLELPDIEPSE